MISKSVLIASALVALQISIIVGQYQSPTFNEEWSFKFDENETRYQKFFLQNGIRPIAKNVHMMQHEDLFRRGRMPKIPAEFIEVDYEDSSSIIILPDEDVSPDYIEEKLKDFDFSEMLILTHNSMNSLYLPKFKLDSAVKIEDLNDIEINKKSWNVGTYYNGAKISALMNITDQIAFMDVNEMGTNTSYPIIHKGKIHITPSDEVPKVFLVNRPFLMIIRWGEAIVLQARIYDPTDSSYIFQEKNITAVRTTPTRE